MLVQVGQWIGESCREANRRKVDELTGTEIDIDGRCWLLKLLLRELRVSFVAID
jgi:hypothetical protein